MAELIQACPPLDVNSVYVYLLLAEHFSETCILVEDDSGLCGLVTGYVPPGRPDTLFIWQVAVAPRARGMALGRRMLRALLGRASLPQIHFIDTTVGPENQASRHLFAGLAGDLRAPMTETALFGAELFGIDGHDAEPLLRIGPFERSFALVASDTECNKKGGTHG